MRSGKKQAGKITLQICIAAVSITCLVFFIHHIVTRRDDVGEAVRVTLSHPMLIVVEFSLMSCGVAVEAARWGVLRSGFIGGDFKSDFTATLRSIALGNATPGNIGEHAGRGMSYADTGKAAIISILASVLQTADIAVLGIAGAAGLWMSGRDIDHTAILVASVLCVCCMVVCAVCAIARGGKMRDEVRQVRWCRVVRHMLASFCIGIVKVLLFSLQLYLLLTVDADCDSELFFAVLFYYLCITVTPRMNIIDVGVKGTWAIAIFSPFVSDARIMSATVALWLVNIVIPSLFGYAAVASWWRGVRR